MPLGLADAATGVAICAPASVQRSRDAAMPVLVPRKASSAELPNQAPSRPKRASGVGTGEKVLVSCFIMAMTARICFISGWTRLIFRAVRRGVNTRRIAGADDESIVDAVAAGRGRHYRRSGLLVGRFLWRADTRHEIHAVGRVFVPLQLVRRLLAGRRGGAADRQIALRAGGAVDRP